MLHVSYLSTFIPLVGSFVFFILDFFSGDRSSDLARIILKEALFFPDKSGILFRQRLGKTLRGDGENVFVFRRCETNILCPVKNFWTCNQVFYSVLLVVIL